MLAPREANCLETPDDERAGPFRLLDELKVRPRAAQRLEARFELDPARGTDTDVDHLGYKGSKHRRVLVPEGEHIAL